MSIRKKIWDHFYAIIVADILICNYIKSPTLKIICDRTHDRQSHSVILEQLNHFFKITDLKEILEISTLIIEETFDKKTAEHFFKQYQSEIICSA
ncbi:MAG: hypothetical protein ACRCVW_06955 [Brevinema sp.]